MEHPLKTALMRRRGRGLDVHMLMGQDDAGKLHEPEASVGAKIEHEDAAKVGDLPHSKSHLKSSVQVEDENEHGNQHLAPEKDDVDSGVNHEDLNDEHADADMAEHLAHGLSEHDKERLSAKGPKSLGERVAMKAMNHAKKPYRP